MSTDKLTTHGRQDRTPADAALLVRLKVFHTMRWFVIAGVIGSALVATEVFNIVFPVLPVYITSAFMIIYNVVMLYQVRGIEELQYPEFRKRVNALGTLHIALDLLSFNVILHYTGGVENPFIFLLGLHIVGASTLLGRRAVYGIASLALLMVGAVVTLELYGIIPHHSLVGFFDQTHYYEPSYLIAVMVALTSILYLIAFMSTAISMELNQKHREIVKLREILLDETTEELSRVSTEISKLREERDKFLRFLGTAAHDLKTPLTAIQGYFRIMLDGYSGKLAETQKRYIERSSTRITDLLGLISDLLDIPRIETGRWFSSMTEISFPELIKSSFTDLHNLATEKGITLNIEVPETLPKVYCSEPRLVQVLTNLGSNSINYTDEGSVTCRVSENHDEIIVAVIDTGIGIPPHDLPHVFEDFFRASNVQAKGTGLGLSISKRIIESHGGRIWVESPSPETGTGSKFVFTLPKRPPPPEVVKKKATGETLT